MAAGIGRAAVWTATRNARIGNLMPGDSSLPQLNLRVEIRNSEAVVICSGWLTRDFVSKFLSDVKHLISEAKGLQLDLAAITHLDSSGIGAVVGVYVFAKNAGCAFRVTNIGEQFRELLETKGMTWQFARFERGSHP